MFTDMSEHIWEESIIIHLNKQPQHLIGTLRKITEILTVSGEVSGCYSKLRTSLRLYSPPSSGLNCLFSVL